MSKAFTIAEKIFNELHSMRMMSLALRVAADNLEDVVIGLLGVEYVPREAGLPCWRIKGDDSRYFNTWVEAANDTRSPV